MPKFEYTKEHIKSSKLALLIGALTAAVADVFVVVLLMIAGLWGYVALPIALAVADIAFFVIALFTNFRFRYSLGYTIGYLAVFIGCVLGHLFIIYGGKETAMTAIALIIWVSVHVLNFLVTVFGAKGAITKKKSHHFVTALIVLLFVGATSLYVAFGATMGYFGQGSTTARPILYVYDEQTKTYTATGVLTGNGTTATIPEEFDGKPVGAIDASLFNANRLNTLKIEAPSNIEIKNLDKLEAVSVTEILAPRETLTTLQREFYTAYRDLDTKNDLLLDLAQCSLPSDLTKDEIYITFSYTDRAVASIGENYLPSWIGKKGDVFKLAELAKNIGYTQDTDVTDEALLHNLYTNNTYGGGYILLPIMLDATTPLDGATVQKSHKNLTVDFEKIYRVKVEEDNDGKHAFSDNFQMGIEVGTEQVAYRYVTPSTVAELIPSVTERPGFTLAWDYKYANTTVSIGELSEAELLTKLNEKNLRDFTIIPTWTMNAPVINSLTSNKTNNAFIYGDNVNLTVIATAPAEGTMLTYEWEFLDTNKENQTPNANVLNISPIQMNQKGQYKVKVIAQAINAGTEDAVTSLTSESVQTIELTVDKKAISMEWFFDDESNKTSNIYDANEHNIKVTFNESDFVRFPNENEEENKDKPTADYTQLLLDFKYSLDGANPTATNSKIKNAGNYSVTISLTNDSAEKYTLTNPTQSYTIEKKSVNVIWTNTQLTYNAAEQAPTATPNADDICGNDDVTLVVSGGKTDTNLKANSQSYQATAALASGSTNANYVLTESTITTPFKIDPLKLSVAWSGKNGGVDDASFTWVYDALSHSPVATFSGFPENSFEDQSVLNLTEGGAATNANVIGTPHVATVTIGNKNYKADAADLRKEFTITAKPLEVEWTQNSFTFNNQDHFPAYEITGFAGNEKRDVLGITEYGAKKYTIKDSPVYFTINNANYSIEESQTKSTVTIEKREIKPVFVQSSLVYNGEVQIPQYSWNNTVSGYDFENNITASTSANGVTSTNVGTYQLTLTIDDPNYIFNGSVLTLTHEFEITKRQLSIESIVNLFVYDGQEHYPTFQTNNLIEGENAGFTFNKEMGIDAGSYSYELTATNPNYSFEKRSINMTIQKKEISPVWDELTLSFTYDGNEHIPTATAKDVSDISFSLEVSGGRTNAGTYNATANLPEAYTKNYTLDNNKTSFTIEKRDVDVVWTIPSFTYNGEAQCPTASATGINGEVIDLTISGGQINAGENYTATAKTTNGNYKLLNNTASFSIEKLGVSAEWNVPDFVYTGKNQKPSATARGVKNAVLTLIVSGEEANAGTNYTATAALSPNDAKNYTLIDHIETSFSIAPLEIQVVWSNDNNLTYNTLPQKPTAKATGVSGIITLSVSGEQINAGTGYTAEASLDNPNYTLTNTTHTFTIKKANVTLPTTNNYPYTGETISSGLKDTDKYTFSEDNGGIHVGTYYLNVTLVDPSNYKWSDSNENATRQLNFKITQAQNSASAPSIQGWTYGDEANTPTSTVKFGDVYFKYATSQNGTYSSTVPSNAGTYYVKAYVDATLDYTAAISSATQFTIAKKTVMVSWLGEDDSETDFEYIYNASVQGPKASAQGINGPLSLTLTGHQKNANGNNDLTATASLSTTDAKNYTLSGETRTFKILPKALEIQWGTVAFEYDGSFKTPTASITSGVCISDSTPSLTYAYFTEAGVKLNGAPVNAGSYKARVSTIATNYALTNYEIEFTISKQTLTLTWANTTLTYNAQAQAPTATAENKNGEQVSVSVSGAQTNAGSYTATASLSATDEQNYTISNPNQTFEIQKYETEIYWENTNLTYTGQAQKPKAYFYDVNNQKVYLTVETTPSSTSNTGTYTASVNLSTNYTTNYEFTGYTSTQYQITAN